MKDFLLLRNQNGNSTIQTCYFVALKYFKNKDIPEELDDNINCTKNYYEKCIKPLKKVQGIKVDVDVYPVSEPKITEYEANGEEVFIGSHQLLGIIVKMKNIE